VDIKLTSHGSYRHQYHIVWIPKYRRRILKGEIKQLTEKSLIEITQYHPDVHVVKMNVREDHVHLVMEIPPRYAVSEIVGKMKQNSSRKIGKKVKGEVVWSPGFFSSTVGLDEKAVMKYVEHQEKVDRGEYQLKLF